MPYPLPPDQQNLPFRGWVNLERPGEQYLVNMRLVFPAAGFETQYATTGDVPSWPDVSRWVAQQWDPQDTGQTTISYFQAVHLVEQFQIAVLEALSGFHNLTVDYVDTVADRAEAAIHDVEVVVGVGTGDLQTKLDQLRDATHLELVLLQQQEQADIAGIGNRITAGDLETIAYLEQWTHDNVYLPLQAQILEAIDLLRHETDVKVLEGIQAVRDQQTVTDTNIIKELGNIGAKVKVATDWLSAIGNPMGDLFGPGTDAGNAVKDFEATNPGDLLKALNALKTLLALFAGVALADLTLADLEGLARTFANLAGNDFADFANAFATGGATLGAASVGVLGDIGEGAADILRELGVPIP